MTILRPGTGIIFMKVGTHAQESLDGIIARKQKEIEQAGFALWGYGGNTCHPQTMVQPFAKSFQRRGQAIYLYMKEMASNHLADPVRADQLSPDGVTWNDIPETVNVLGSRYALVLKSLRRETLALPLHRTRVAVGPSRGRPGNVYVAGKVDKACLEFAPDADTVVDESDTPIHLVAELAPPFAVFLRNRTGFEH